MMGMGGQQQVVDESNPNAVAIAPRSGFLTEVKETVDENTEPEIK